MQGETYAPAAYYDPQSCTVTIERAQCAPCGEVYALSAEDNRPCPNCGSRDRIYIRPLRIAVDPLSD